MDSKRIENIQSVAGIKAVLNDINDEVQEALSAASDAHTKNKVRVATAAGKEHKKTNKLNLKQFIKSGTPSYTEFASEKGLPLDGNTALYESELNTNVIEQAIQNSAILSAVGKRSTDNLDYRRTVLTVRPEVQLTAENTGFVAVAETAAQDYDVLSGLYTKMYSFPRLTNEVMEQSDVQVESNLIKLLAEQFEITMQDQVLHGDGTGTGTKADPQQLRGITNAAIDRANSYAEALKPAATRARDVFAAVASGAASDIGTDAATLEANLYKLMLTVPERSQASSSFAMHPDTLSFLMQTLKGNDGHSLIKINNIQSNGVWVRRLSLFGAPIILNETMDVIAANNAPVVFGDFSEAYELLQPNSGATHFIQDQFTIPDTVGFYMDSLFGSIVADHEALAVLVVKA